MPTDVSPARQPIATNNVPVIAGIALSPMELKAISVPQSLLFLLSIEYDMFLCITTVGIKNSFKLAINTRLAPSYRLLLESGAKRFGLTVVHTETESIIISNGSSAHMPLLRYVDYIPGSLHVDELLNCFGIDTKTLPRKAKTCVNTTKESSIFEACFIDYSPYVSDEALHDVHGCGFYLTLDYGLSLATHAHLLQVTFMPDRKSFAQQTAANNNKRGGAGSNNNSGVYVNSLASFLKFSGWDKLDLRFEDDSKRSAVVVLPTTQDANDLLEKYENEESDNDIDDYTDPTVAAASAFRPNFHVRPIASTVSVPYIEDSTLRRLRTQHWGKIESFWKTCVANKNTITVSNLYDGCSLEEVLRLFDAVRSSNAVGPCSGAIVSASMTEDDGPSKRRRVFVTFATSEESREALSLDGKNTHGKSLKIHTAPPYVDTSRRGKCIAAKGLGLSALMPSAPSSTLAAPAPTPAGHDIGKSPGLNVAAKEFVPKFAMGGSFALPPPYSGGGSPSGGMAAAMPPPAYGGGGSPMTGAPALPPPAYGGRPAAAGTSNSVSPAGGSALVNGMPPMYSLPPPYTPKPAAPPPAYTPSPASNVSTPTSPQ